MRADGGNIPASHASAFHRVACSFLAVEGCALAGDPRVVIRYGGSEAFYRSARGLALSVGFEPFDGNYVEVSFGREWRQSGQRLFLSSRYSALALHFGFHVPEYYSLGHGTQHQVVVEQVASDLRRSLPLVLARVTLSDLLTVESDSRGAATRAARMFGPDYSTVVSVSEFYEEKG